VSESQLVRLDEANDEFGDVGDVGDPQSSVLLLRIDRDDGGMRRSVDSDGDILKAGLDASPNDLVGD
jgi:hypothetical protein